MNIYDDKKFISYLNYTNKKIALLLNDLLSKTNNNSVIIIQGDHGYRGFARADIGNHFKNLSAIFFPDHNYGLLYSTMTNVNTFRVLLNKYFFAKLPMLSDSTIVLKD